jgi:hypothetical protein
LDGGQEKGDQDADDGNDNQEFHQRETALTSSPHGCSLSRKSQKHMDETVGPP